MAHFYGSIRGNRGEATRCGARNSGYRAVAAGWQGAIEVNLYYQNGKDYFVVHLTPWGCGGGRPITLARGELDSTAYAKGELLTLNVNAQQAHALAQQCMTEDS